MGNCQAAEAATVVIQHPGRKIERIYKSVSAKEIMTSNPGHYVALIVTSPSAKSENGTPLKQLKLLRPDDTLHLGQVYRLVSFEEVLKEFAEKKCVKLGKLLKAEKVRNNCGEKRKKHLHRGGGGGGVGGGGGGGGESKQPENSNAVKVQVEQEIHRLVVGGSSSSNTNNNNNGSSSNSSRGGVGTRQQQQHYHQHQWRPALESISEIGT